VNKTEIVLLITPRVIRNIERPGAKLEEFNSGTELEIGRGGGPGASIPAISVQPEAPKAPAQPEAPKPAAKP
jgi:general secretion pathway protein D